MPEQQKTQTRLMATFAAMVDNQDQSIGQLLDYLKSTKQLVNRLIIDLSDNDPEAFDG
jgi:arylsulfatase